MDKDSIPYHLMDIQVNEGLDGITQADEEYQEIGKRSRECLHKLDMMRLPQEVRALINQHASEQNTLGARYGALAYLLGFSDCIELIIGSSHFRPLAGKQNRCPCPSCGRGHPDVTPFLKQSQGLF